MNDTYSSSNINNNGTSNSQRRSPPAKRAAATNATAAFQSLNDSPQAQQTGTSVSQIPLARVKKIMKEEVEKMGNDAVVAVSLAAEQFTEYLIKHAFEYSKRDKRKGIAYKDLANVVLELEQFQFLTDVIPQSLPPRETIEKHPLHSPEDSVSTDIQGDQSSSAMPVDTC